MAHPRLTRRAAHAVVAALLGLIALAGCSGGSADSPSAGPAEERDAGEAGGDPFNAQPTLGAAPPQNGDGSAARVAPVDERSLIYVGRISVRVESVVRAADEAIAIATGLGGIVAGDTRSIDDSGSQATLVLRVPAAKFNSTLDSLADLGTEEGRDVTAEDVTEALVDLDARIATQQASVTRVRELLARAQTIGEIVSIESELTNRQAELDSLLQRRAAMGGLVELATITVVLYGPSGPVTTATEEETGFLAGLRNGWKGFLASVAVVLTVAGWLLPWAIAVGGPALLITWLVRLRRRRGAAATSE